MKTLTVPSENLALGSIPTGSCLLLGLHYYHYSVLFLFFPPTATILGKKVGYYDLWSLFSNSLVTIFTILSDK